MVTLKTNQYTYWWIFDLEPSAKPDQKVQLVDELCNSADCFITEKDAVNDNYPVDYEAVEKQIEIGTALETLSGMAKNMHLIKSYKGFLLK